MLKPVGEQCADTKSRNLYARQSRPKVCDTSSCSPSQGLSTKSWKIDGQQTMADGKMSLSQSIKHAPIVAESRNEQNNRPIVAEPFELV